MLINVMLSWECIPLRSMRLNFRSITYRDSNNTFGREKCDRLNEIRDPNRCWTQYDSSWEEATHCAYRSQSLLFNSLTVFRWAQHNIVITKGISNYKVSTAKRKRKETGFGDGLIENRSLWQQKSCQRLGYVDGSMLPKINSEILWNVHSYTNIPVSSLKIGSIQKNRY